MSLGVLYEDNHLIAVFKPAGVLVQGDQSGAPTLMDEVKYYLKVKYHKTGQVFLGLLHRLDRPVAGIILFAKTSKGASRLSEQFRNRSVIKIYQALVVGGPAQPKGALVNFLVKDKNKNSVKVSAAAVPGSQRAQLSYEVIKKIGENSLLKITLGTGRPHQIRAQFGAIGCPVVGDVKYGAPAPLPDRSLALLATSLTFATATDHRPVTVSVPVPSAWTRARA